MSLDEAKQWVNLDADITQDDALLSGLISAAREHIESVTTLVLVDSIFEMRINEYPCDGEIRLPVQPLIGVIDVQHIGNDGEYVVLSTEDWIAVADEPPRIVQNWNGTFWPAIAARPGGVIVTFRAGYESAGSPQDATKIPNAVKTALKMLVAHWYEHREATSTDHRNTPTEIPLGVDVLLQPYRRVT